MRRCPFCHSETTTSICADCAETLGHMNVQVPAPEATDAEVEAWADRTDVDLGAFDEAVRRTTARKWWANDALVDVPHLSLRLQVERVHRLPTGMLLDAGGALAVAHHVIGDRPVEHVVAILLDAAARITGVVTVAQGGMSTSHVAVADVLRPVLTGHAQAFVLAHNHPSGDPTPSEQDVDFTRKVRAATEVVGLTLLDHLVVTARAGRHAIVPCD